MRLLRLRRPPLCGDGSPATSPRLSAGVPACPSMFQHVCTRCPCYRAPRCRTAAAPRNRIAAQVPMQWQTMQQRAIAGDKRLFCDRKPMRQCTFT